MQQYVGQKVLITTNNWFVAPNGRDYRAVWGELKAVHEAGRAMGFTPNRAHANWFYEVGNMIIMGCQVMYLMRCDERPAEGMIKEWSAKDGINSDWHDRPTTIFISE